MFTAVEGTPAGSPTAPSDNDIQTDLGAGVRWHRLANVAVANGFATIVDANITDTRDRTFIESAKVGGTQTYADTISEFTAGAGVTVDSLLIKDGRVVHWDGWSSAEETWTYASATTFTIAGVDRTARYKKGTKIKLTQGTDKYFVVYSSSFSTNTTITIIPTTDYTLANAAITNPLYSYIEAPAGWPDWFNFDPQFSVSGGTVPTFTDVSMSMWRVIGKRIEVELNHVNTSGGTAGSGAQELRHVPPTIVPSSIYSNSDSRGFLGIVYSSGINMGFVRMRLSNNSISFTSADAGSAALGNSYSGSTRFISARYSYFY